MNSFVNFCVHNYILFLILAVLFGFGIAGYFVDKSTNALTIEKKKKALIKKNMNINEIKKQIKDKSKGLNGSAGNSFAKGGNDNVESLEEDLNVPLNLNNK